MRDVDQSGDGVTEHFAEHAAAQVPQILGPGSLGLEAACELAVDRLRQVVIEDDLAGGEIDRPVRRLVAGRNEAGQIAVDGTDGVEHDPRRKLEREGGEEGAKKVKKSAANKKKAAKAAADAADEE